METLGYSFTWLKNSTEENKMFGQMNLVQFQGFVGVGDQPVNGTLHWFIAEQTIPYKFEIRHVIKLAILEKDGEYKLDDKSVTKIF